MTCRSILGGVGDLQGWGGLGHFTNEAMMSRRRAKKKKKVEWSEWQVNWWDLRTSGSGPDVEARRGGMVCQLIRLCSPPRCGNGSSEGGRTCSSEYLNNLIVPAPTPASQRLGLFLLTEMATGMCSLVCWHQRGNVSVRASEIIGYYLKWQVNLWLLTASHSK